MTDMEKVIKRLEEISDYFFSVYHHSKDREEINEAKDRCDAVEDAIALLKEHKELARNLHEVQHPCNFIEQYEPDEKGWRFGAKKKLFDDGNNTGK